MICWEDILNLFELDFAKYGGNRVSLNIYRTGGPRQSGIWGHYSNAVRGRLKKEDSQPEYHIIEDDAPVGLNRSWARLIQKIYEVNPLTCPRFGKIMKIIAFIEDYRW